MTARTSLALTAAALVLAGCAAAPATPMPVAAPSPMVMSSGLVIGTLSYQYVDAGKGAPWVVHLQRVDTPQTQDYALAVAIDQKRHRGVFTGALPAGVYTFREAATEKKRFSSGALMMPFEVHTGEVKDAGHFPLKPLDGI